VKRDSLSTRSERPQEPLTDLERSEFYLREGERLAQMGSWSLRVGGIFDYWSPETFLIFDFDSSRGIPTLTQWLFREGVRGDVRYWVDHPKKGKRMMHSTGEPVLENGKVTRLIGNTLDITEQENALEEIRRLKDELYKENIVLREEINSTSMFEEVLGTSAVLQRVLASS
jgi:PAS domain-containing protein